MLNKYGNLLFQLIADYDKLISYATDNPVEKVLENLSFESEILEVRRASLVVPYLREEDKNQVVYDISDDDDVLLFGFDAETGVDSPYDNRGSKAKKAFVKTETQTKSGSTKNVSGKSSRTVTST